MESLQAYQVLVIPVFAALVAQFLKFSIKKGGNGFNIKSIAAYSGMPSGHSAFVISLATTLALVDGVISSTFAISVVLAIIVIRDALGIRMYLGQHGHILNTLVKELDNDHLLEDRYPHLLENIGHTPLQALAGSLIGFVISLACFWMLN